MVIFKSSDYSNYESSGLENIEFTTGPSATGTVLQAWLERGATNISDTTVYWVNLGSSIIPANGNLVIYMNFMPVSVMSNTGPTGEAPQLSGTYGQYDNGGLVFNSYTAWGGLSGGNVPTGISTTGNETIINNPTNTQLNFKGGQELKMAHIIQQHQNQQAIIRLYLKHIVAMYGKYQWFGTGEGNEQGGNGVIVTWIRDIPQSDLALNQMVMETG